LKFDLIKITDLSGSKATIYAIKPEGVDTTLFDDFIIKYQESFPDEINYILTTLNIMGKKYGARSGYFKDKEGSPGDFMKALYDSPGKNLRLYCIEMNSCVVIIGSGALKPKSVKAWQDDVTLYNAAAQTKACADVIMRRIDKGLLFWTSNQEELEGDFNDFETKD